MDQSKALGGATEPIASSVGRSEAPKTLGEFHRSLPQGNPAAVSDILNNPETIRLSGLSTFAGHGRRKWVLDGFEFCTSKYTTVLLTFKYTSKQGTF